MPRHRLGRRAGERGATAVEYGLMVALIAVVIIVAVTLLGNNRLIPIEGVGPDFAVVGASVRG